MATIKGLTAKEILDSRGNPTIQVDLELDSGETVSTSVPNGIRPYPSEAKVLLDQDPEHKGGRGVQKAVNLINQTFAPQIVGQDPTQQETIDQLLLQLDGTPDKAQVGANTLIAISQAVAKSGAVASQLELYEYLLQKYQLTDHTAIPVCLYGLINGGQYGADNLDIQEFLVIPASHIDYRVSLEIESALRTILQDILKERKANYAMGELGGFTPSLQKNSDVFEFIVEAARKTAYILARDFFFGIDTGAEQLLDKSKYLIKDKSTAYSENELAEYYKDLQKQYSLTYFEDPFVAKDTRSWQSFTADLGKTARVASDILTATNPQLVQSASQNQLANTLVVKPSQIGTLTETLESVRIAKKAGWSIVVSQRTGETNDDFLADLAVGIGAEFVKFGPTNRGEAVAKYNRLADIYLKLEENIKKGTNMQTDQPTGNNPTSPGTSTNNSQPATPMTPSAPPLPTAQPSAPAEKPAETPAINEQVSLGDTDAVTNPTNTPSAPAAPPASMPSAPAMPKPGEALINTPPMAAPMTPPAPPAEPVAQEPPAEAEVQKTIDHTLQEIGATQPTPSAPPAPAVESVTPPATGDKSL
jgi:enolase